MFRFEKNQPVGMVRIFCCVCFIVVKRCTIRRNACRGKLSLKILAKSEWVEQTPFCVGIRKIARMSVYRELYMGSTVV